MNARLKQQLRILTCKLMYAALFLLLVRAPAFAQDKPAPTTPRMIPGITAPDPVPGGCVDCHVKMPQMDVRLSTLVKQWNEAVPEPILAKAQAAAPAGVKLTGKHPAVTSFQNIPTGCLMCHGRNSTKAPPFARMLHLIHLTGGAQNHFLTMFQGECTMCHKLDAATGAWSLSSGKEKEPGQ